MLREERERTQDQLAELIGKTTEHVSALERGARAPSLEVMLDLARALNVPISHLLRIDAMESSLSVVESLTDVAPH